MLIAKESNINIIATSNQLAKVVTGNISLKRKLAGIEIFKKSKTKLSSDSIKSIFKYFGICNENEIKPLYIQLKPLFTKESSVVIFHSCIDLLRKRKINVQLYAYFLTELTDCLSFRMNPGSEYQGLMKKIFILCDSLCEKDLSNLLYITQYSSGSILYIQYIDYLFGKCQKYDETEQLADRILNLYINTQNEVLVEKFLDILSGKVWCGALQNYFSKSVISILMDFAEKNPKFQQDISNFLALYKIHKPYPKTKKWWDGNKTSFSASEYLFKLALYNAGNDPYDKTAALQLLNYTCIFKHMLDLGAPGFREILAKNQKRLITIMFNKNEKYVTRSNAFTLVEVYESEDNENHLPSIYYKTLKSFARVLVVPPKSSVVDDGSPILQTDSLQTDILINLSDCDTVNFDKSITKNLWNILKNPQNSLRVRLNAARVLINKKTVPNKKKFASSIFNLFTRNYPKLQYKHQKTQALIYLSLNLRGLGAPSRMNIKSMKKAIEAMPKGK